jgi:hypothetical protein
MDTKPGGFEFEGASSPSEITRCSSSILSLWLASGSSRDKK